MTRTPASRKPAPVAASPGELHTLFLDCVRRRDHEGLMALYASDCAGSDLDGNILPDRAAISEFTAGFLAIVGELTATTRTVRVAGATALLSSDWHATVEPGNGTLVEAGGRSAEVARRQPDGSWLFVIDTPVFASLPRPGT